MIKTLEEFERGELRFNNFGLYNRLSGGSLVQSMQCEVGTFPMEYTWIESGVPFRVQLLSHSSGEANHT